MPSFEDLKISKQIGFALAEGGYTEPTPIQEQAFSAIRSGKDIIGIAQTGTGKTFAYLIPLLMKLNYAKDYNPRAVIIVPTRELVVQICESIEMLVPYMDIRYEGIYGGTNISTQQNKIAEGVDLVIATPGRFMDIYMNGMLRTKSVKTIIVDEADKLMDLGFFPQLKAIFDVLPDKHQKMLFSATFSDTIATLSEDFLISPTRIEVERQATPVKHINQVKYNLPNILTKINFLKFLLKNKEEFTKVMVFTETKKNADRIVSLISDLWSEEISVIHSNKAQNTRLNALKSFKSGKTRIMISSDVAARGIDIENVSHVINFDIPTLPEEYVHRIGRTGRAGKDGTAISFIGPKEAERITEIETLIEQEIPHAELPENLEISSILLDDEKIQSRNIQYQRGGIQGGGAFHTRIAKNSKINGKVYKRKMHIGKKNKK